MHNSEPDPAARSGRDDHIAELDMGRVVPWLLRHPRDWVHRRVETCTFVDDHWTRRRISIDYTLPVLVEERRVDDVLDYVPLALLAKRSLRGFDLRDASGRALSLLTTDENTEVAHQAIASFAGDLCQAGLEKDVSKDLYDIVGPNRQAGQRALVRMYEADGQEPEDESTRQRRMLIRDSDFASILSELADNFLLLTPRLEPAGIRQIVKYGYEDPLKPKGEILMWPAIRLGLVAARLVLPLPAARSALSFHCEIEAPVNLEITRARIDRDAIYQPDLTSLSHSDQRLRKRRARALNRSLEVRDGGGIARAHLQLPRTDLNIGPRPRAVVWLRSRRAGFLRPAFVTCLLTTALLIAGHERLPVLESEVEPASTLMLLVPGLLAVYLSRPGEHVLASSLLLGVRLMLIMSGLCAVAAAALLLADLHPRTLSHWWTLMRDLSVGASVAVLAANLLPVRHAAWENDGIRWPAVLQ